MVWVLTLACIHSLHYGQQLADYTQLYLQWGVPFCTELSLLQVFGVNPVPWGCEYHVNMYVEVYYLEFICKIRLNAFRTSNIV